MKALALKLGGDPDQWEVLGLIHDSDWEETKDHPDQHTLLTIDRIDDPKLIHALQSHNTSLTHLADLEGQMEWALETCDELTGFIVAVALITPDKKLASVTVDSILRKFASKSFAAAVHREQIKMCDEKLGIPLEKFIEIVLSSMQKISSDLGL